MNIIKSDSRCHRYRIHPMCFPTPPPPPPPNKNLFRVGNIEHKQASEQPNKQSKPTNIKNSRTKGPNRRLHAIVFS